jgi:hypothetical protein
MRWTRSLSWLRSAAHRHAPAVRYRPRLEALESRQLLSHFTVVLATDNGGPAGQMVTATTGDLRYCIEQADAAHVALTDTISFSSTLFATPQTITLNRSTGTLVLQDTHPLTIHGPVANTATVSGNDQVGVLDISGGTVTISHLAITHGHSGAGGGVKNSGTLTLKSCTLDHDAAFAGNGGAIENGGTVTLINCTLNHDLASSQAGGIDNEVGRTATLTKCTLSNDSAVSRDGGAIYNAGTATLTKCILSNDSTLGSGFGGGAISNARTLTLSQCTLSNDSAQIGGGIANGGGVTLTNCTLSNNSAIGLGGAIANGGGVTLTNCTVANNSAHNGGGIANPTGNGGTLVLTNTIVADNNATFAGPDIFGTVNTADHDLVGNASGSMGISNGGGNLVGGNGNPVIDPRLGPLQNNGGPTQTLALLPDSPAIAHGDNAKAPATDQRGHTRIDEAGETTDIGAFEF